jgi:hypothetical protein
MGNPSQDCPDTVRLDESVSLFIFCSYHSTIFQAAFESGVTSWIFFGLPRFRPVLNFPFA